MYLFKLFTILIVVSSLCSSIIESISIVKDSNNELVDELPYYMKQADDLQYDTPNYAFNNDVDEEMMQKLMSYAMDRNNRMLRRNRHMRNPLSNLELCRNVNCNRIHSNGQVSKTWRVAQLVSCCPALRNKKKIF